MVFLKLWDLFIQSDPSSVVFGSALKEVPEGGKADCHRWLRPVQSAHADTAALAQRLSVSNVIRRAAAIGGLRENFGRNVQEQLAVEVAFMDAFAA